MTINIAILHPNKLETGFLKSSKKKEIILNNDLLLLLNIHFHYELI